MRFDSPKRKAGRPCLTHSFSRNLCFSTFRGARNLRTRFSSGSVESGLSVPLHAFKDGFRDLDDLSDELDNR